MEPTEICGVTLTMYKLFQIKTLLQICQLIEWHFGDDEAAVSVSGEHELNVSFFKKDLPSKKWTDSEKRFFDGLIMLGLIRGWDFYEDQI